MKSIDRYLTADQTRAALYAIGADGFKVWCHGFSQKPCEIEINGMIIWENPSKMDAFGKLTDEGLAMLRDVLEDVKQFDAWFSRIGHVFGDRITVLHKMLFSELPDFPHIPKYSEDVGRYYCKLNSLTV